MYGQASVHDAFIFVLSWLTDERVSQVNGLWGERCVEASSARRDYCWLTDEGLDSAGSFASLRVRDGQVSDIVCAYSQLILKEKKKKNRYNCVDQHRSALKVGRIFWWRIIVTCPPHRLMLNWWKYLVPLEVKLGPFIRVPTDPRELKSKVRVTLPSVWVKWQSL